MPRTTDSIRDRVADIIRQLRPAVQSDGGDIELIDVDPGGVVTVRLHGACIGCPSAGITLKMGVEQSLKENIPEIQKVVCID